MANEPKRIYWDSCVFIDALRKTSARWPKIQELENQAKSGKLIIFTSTLAIAEVVKLKEHGELTEAERHLISGYFRNKFVRVVPVDRVIAKSAADIVRVHSLKPPDAIHVATAIRTVCCVLFTYDGDGGDSTKMLGKNEMIGLPAIPIKRPGEFGDALLFGEKVL
jgi:predicted nucleic acid-binding protein